MAYIYKKIIGEKPYYYLRISKRVNDRVITKDIAYLGDDPLQIHAKLDKLPLHYKKELRKGYKNIKKFIDTQRYLTKVKKLKSDPYCGAELLRNIEGIKLHFKEHFSKLNAMTQHEVYENFLIEFAYNTTSIEGNTITLQEAEKLLREQLTPKNKSPREIFDLQNTQKVFFYLLEQKPAFNEELLIKIHDMLIENIDVRKGYRTHDIRVFKSRFEASHGIYVKADMNLLFTWYSTCKDTLHPFALACLFHHKLEKIHPFSDGNGRTGRMILNYMLLHENYPPLILQKKRRVDYLKALSVADTAGIKDIEPDQFRGIVRFIAEELITSYWNNFNV